MTISANRIAMLANGRPSMQSAARLALLILGLALGAEIVPAMAQSASSGLSTYKNGYSGSGLSGLESPVNVSTRDANGNLVVTNGVIQTASSSSIFSQSGGAGYSATGVGASVGGGATAIGNNLTVTVSGDNNTVIVKATQTNTGAITATDTVLNGKVNLNAGQ